MSNVKSTKCDLKLTPYEFCDEILRCNSTVYTNESGQIDISSNEKKVQSCLYCAKLLELYLLRGK